MGAFLRRGRVHGAESWVQPGVLRLPSTRSLLPWLWGSEGEEGMG